MEVTMSKVITVKDAELEIQTPRYLALVDRCLLHKKEAGESIVKLGEALYEADFNLSRKEVMSLCAAVGIVYDKPTWRKFVAIGKASSRFEKYLDKVPNNWTSVYKLAALKPSKFELVTKSDRFSAFMTGRDIDEIIGNTKAKKKGDVSINLTGPLEPMKIKLYNELTALKKQYGFRLTASDDLIKIADASQSQAA
jgi:hypothetical protein